MMKKEDFKYGCPEYYLENEFVIDSEDYILAINEEIFDDETIRYADSIIEKFRNEKNNIIDYMLDNRLREHYSVIYNYSDQFIKDNIGRPQIIIFSKKDKDHPNWKFQYAGIINFCESKLDEHIISIEFIDDLSFIYGVQMNG